MSGHPRLQRAASTTLIGAAITVVSSLGPGATTDAWAEPSIAVRTGYSCGQCHVNRTGGGMRTAFGSLYSQTIQPARLLRWKEKGYVLPADPNALFAAGADVRAGYYAVDADQAEDTSTFEVPAAQVYAQLRVVPEKFSLYVDQRLGSGGSSTRELFALLSFGKSRGYVKLGRFFPPYGWALPDDAAFIREPLGFAFSASDVGVEIGFAPGKWTSQLALVNGTPGQRDQDRGKMITLVTTRRWRHGTIGLTSAWDDAATGTTIWGGVLGGLSFGRLAVLGEYDARRSRVHDATDTARRVAMVEADFLLRRGLNVKFTHDWMDPDRSIQTDQQSRDSLGVEYIPYPFVQLRMFVRRGDGPPQVVGAKDTKAELEAHFFF